MEGQWQPIETAPLDGSDVLVTAPGDDKYRARIWISHWVDSVSMNYGRVTSERKYWSEQVLSPLNLPQPSHWMPLPAYPHFT